MSSSLGASSSETGSDGAGPPQAAGQPYRYQRRELVEPDWRRFPGWADVSVARWHDAQWQRAHCLRTVGQLRGVLGNRVAERFYADLAADQAEMATMSMLLPPQMLNTMVPDPADSSGTGGDLTAALYADPVRRYMLPLRSERDPVWPSHPRSVRDSLHEAEMWVVEGLTHRYPTKVLAELLSTCPQYCGHCTRMDLVGNSTTQVAKLAFTLTPADRQDRMLDYLRRTPSVRDVVVSGGDVANLPWHRLEAFVTRLLDIDTVRDIRLASKALAGLPQHWLQPQVVQGLARVAGTARRRGVNLAIHTHVNHVHSVTPLVAEAVRTALEAGVRDVRNQGVLLRGVNTTAEALLDLCFALHGEAGVVPYYFYLCDMIPGSEHWRIAVWQAQALQEAILGWLPGYATPRIVCDVPYAGKRWVHQSTGYDRTRGITYWTKNYRTGIERADTEPGTSRYRYYDPIATLPAAGQAWWRRHAAT
jgi:lysine 2,3-aminomutase